MPDTSYNGAAPISLYVGDQPVIAVHTGQSVSAQLPAPTLTVTAGDEEILLEWSAVPGATGYRVGHNFNGGWETVDPPETLSRLLTHFTNGVPVTMHVQALPGGAVATAIATPTVPAVPEAGLAWALDYTTLRNSPKKVLAHYFGPYPRSINNAATISQDNYRVYYNNPSYSEYVTVGGMFRDRPIFRPPISGDYKYQDAVYYIEQARAAGIDGFYCDLLGLSGTNYDNYLKMIQAAHDLNNGFVVAPMVDANGATASASVAQAADHIRKYALTGGVGSARRNGAWFLDDGRFVVGSFKVEGKTAAWWQSLFDQLQTAWGLTVAFVGVAVNSNTLPNYQSIQWASGAWGYGADPKVIRAASNQAAASRSRGELAHGAIEFQQIRPAVNNGNWFDEALNSEALRASWEKCVNENADHAQMTTWNDFSETPMAPSVQHGWCVLDVSTYYIARWKTGQYPTILRDCLYLSHRSQMLGATLTGPMNNPMSQNLRGGNVSALRNDAEVLCFLTAPATITLTIDGVDHTYSAPAGLSAFHQAVTPGAISATATRGSAVVAEVTSPVAVRTSDVSDDYGYYWFSSLRGTTGQFDVLGQYR